VDALDDALRVIRSLNDAGVDYVVVGGVAINLHGLVRATEDLDLFVRPDPDNIDRLRRALRAVWSDPDIDQITAEDLCGDYPAVRYGPPEGMLYLDILTRLGEATAFSDLEVEEKEVAGVRIRVATPKTLYRMKKDTVRPIDRGDALALRAAFDIDDEG
jgi:Nucleotidyl transferase AbiEii toxin, Type IV TA system